MCYQCSRREFMAGMLALGLGAASGDARANVGGGVKPYRGLVILVQFPNTPLPQNKTYVAERFRFLDYYVREMSYGKSGVDVHLTGWHRLAEPVTRYAISPINFDVDRSRVVKLIQDAIDAADDTNDFSGYDFVVVFLGASFADYGMVGLCGYPGMLGFSQSVPLRTRRGQTVPGGVAIFTTSAPLGTLFHDSAHVWGGVRDGKRAVPCLYDHDLQAIYPTRARGFDKKALINMGFWDPMSCHFYKPNVPPPGISSWTKLRLGWLPPEKVRTVERNRPAEILLGPLEDGRADTLSIRVPLTQDRYLLIENRQPIGRFDPHLPEHGVLIMTCDDRIAECRRGLAPVKLIDANPARENLEGAAFDLPERGFYESAADGVVIQLLKKIGSSYRIRIG